jgi:hypothetical protein
MYVTPTSARGAYCSSNPMNQLPVTTMAKLPAMNGCWAGLIGGHVYGPVHWAYVDRNACAFFGSISCDHSRRNSKPATTPSWVGVTLQADSS